jgi:hypothetical protein
MATLNLGRIKPVFRGAYNNSTAYVVDDIVTSSGSSYICIQASTGNAVSNATYWTQMAAGGTDVGTTLTTQGDILYRDGSGLQKLAKPASDKFLQNTSGGVLSWETVSSPVLGVSSFTSTTRNSNLNNNSYTTHMSGNFTKSSASSKLTIITTYSQYNEANGAGTTQFAFGNTNVYSGTSYGNTAGHQKMVTNHFYIPNNTQTGSLGWQLNIKSGGGTIFLPNSSDDSRIDSSREAVVTITEHL